MQTRVIKFENVLLASIIAMLGFGSCHDEEGGEEYGCPHSTFVLSGYVYDDEGKPLKDILVIRPFSDTTNTDLKGRYSFPDFTETNIKLVVEDPNGIYEVEREYELEREQIEKGDDRWYDGKFKVTHNFVLKKKENDENENEK